MADKDVKFTRHHRRPRSIGGCDQDWNISILPEKQHQAWHTLFGNMTAFEIAKLINEKYLDSRYVFEINVRTKRNG